MSRNPSRKDAAMRLLVLLMALWFAPVSFANEDTEEGWQARRALVASARRSRGPDPRGDAHRRTLASAAARIRSMGRFAGVSHRPPQSPPRLHAVKRPTAARHAANTQGRDHERLLQRGRDAATLSPRRPGDVKDRRRCGTRVQRRPRAADPRGAGGWACSPRRDSPTLWP